MDTKGETGEPGSKQIETEGDQEEEKKRRQTERGTCIEKEVGVGVENPKRYEYKHRFCLYLISTESHSLLHSKTHFKHRSRDCKWKKKSDTL